MVLTFLLFVGSAVLSVAVYTLFVLKTDAERASIRYVQQQADRLVQRLEPLSSADQAVFLYQYAMENKAFVRIDGLTAEPLTAFAPTVTPGLQMQIARKTSVSEAPTIIDLYERDAQTLMVGVVSLPEQTNVTVTLAQPPPALYLLVNRMEYSLLIGMFMALILALLGSWLAASKVTRPLQAIRRRAEDIIGGQYNTRIQATTQAAEIQDLAKYLNLMASAYREKIEELEGMTRVQNEFIGNISHEVRNPLFAVGGYLEAMLSPSLPDEMRLRYAQKGLGNLQRLNALFSDLIEIARLEYREDIMRPEQFDLQEVIEEVCEPLHVKARDKGLILEVENPPHWVSADRNRIRQVLTNLIENGINYTEKGTVRCRLRQVQQRIRVEVIDSGKGIAEEHLPRIFERFYRVDPDRSRRGGGTGLGLSIVKQIVQAHDSDIFVDSTLGSGTRFWFELAEAAERDVSAMTVVRLPADTPEST